MLLPLVWLYSLQRVLRFDDAMCMATYFSQNTVPIPSRCACQHFCALTMLCAWPLTSAKTRFLSCPDALVNISVLCTELRLECGGKTTAARFVHSITFYFIFKMGHKTTRTILIESRSWWGLEHLAFWDFSQSVTGDRWKCGWPVREGLHYRNADRRWTEVNHQCVRERQTLRANLWPVICVIIYVIILLMVDLSLCFYFQLLYNWTVCHNFFCTLIVCGKFWCGFFLCVRKIGSLSRSLSTPVQVAVVVCVLADCDVVRAFYQRQLRDFCASSNFKCRRIFLMFACVGKRTWVWHAFWRH